MGALGRGSRLALELVGCLRRMVLDDVLGDYLGDLELTFHGLGPRLPLACRALDRRPCSGPAMGADWAAESFAHGPSLAVDRLYNARRQGCA